VLRSVASIDEHGEKKSGGEKPRVRLENRRYSARALELSVHCRHDKVNAALPHDTIEAT